MYPSRVPLAVPWWNRATYRALFRSLSSGRIVRGSDLTALRSRVMEKLAVTEAILCGSGSLALEIALAACSVGHGDEVIIPTFCCTAVIPPILAVGAVPVLADAGYELNVTTETVAAVMTEKTKAIVVPHLFGNPADIAPIVELAAARNLCVIDDAAQALGATIDARPVGSFGDVGILSFGREKICSGLGGGAAVFGRNGVAGDCAGGLPPPGVFPALENFLSALVWGRWRRWTFPLERFLTTESGPDEPPTPYRREAMANLAAAVASSLLETLEENIAARRARVAAYRELLGKEGRLRLIPHRPGSACLAQVIRLEPRRGDDDPASRSIEALADAGYEVQGSYVPIHRLPIYQRWGRAPLPCAERVWADLIELPCEPGVSFDDLERIAAIVRRVVQA
ncbi:MAG TPA: DegT/DnrJ/EryC1/StrS family aminotransferase [Thermoanaerobaculia bacterium]